MLKERSSGRGMTGLLNEDVNDDDDKDAKHVDGDKDLRTQTVRDHVIV